MKKLFIFIFLSMVFGNANAVTCPSGYELSGSDLVSASVCVPKGTLVGCGISAAGTPCIRTSKGMSGMIVGVCGRNDQGFMSCQDTCNLVSSSPPIWTCPASLINLKIAQAITCPTGQTRLIKTDGTAMCVSKYKGVANVADVTAFINQNLGKPLKVDSNSFGTPIPLNTSKDKIALFIFGKNGYNIISGATGPNTSINDAWKQDDVFNIPSANVVPMSLALFGEKEAIKNVFGIAGVTAVGSLDAINKIKNLPG